MWIRHAVVVDHEIAVPVIPRLQQHCGFPLAVLRALHRRGRGRPIVELAEQEDGFGRGRIQPKSALNGSRHLLIQRACDDLRGLGRHELPYEFLHDRRSLSHHPKEGFAPFLWPSAGCDTFAADGFQWSREMMRSRMAYFVSSTMEKICSFSMT